MNFKRLLILGLILIAVSTTFSAISAETTTTSQSKLLVDNNLTLNGLQFIIPDGFEEVESDVDNVEKDIDSFGDDDSETDNFDSKDVEDIDGTAVDAATTCEFKNSANEKLEIQVGIKGNDQKIESINPAGYEQKNIAGKDGFFKKDSDDGKDQFKFQYLEDGKIVKITATNEDLINKLLA